LPTIHVGSIEEYQSSRSGSGLSREELLDEQDAMEQILVKNAAARGVSLMGAVETMRRATAAGSAAAARGGKRKRAAAVSAQAADAVSSIAAVSAAADVPSTAAVLATAAVSSIAAVSAAAAVSSAAAVVSKAGSNPCSEVAFSSRGRRLRPRQMSPESDD
jgi:hypothetical protein